MLQQCVKSCVATDAVKLNIRRRGDSRITATVAVQDKLESSSLGSDGDVQLLIEGCLMLLPPVVIDYGGIRWCLPSRLCL